LYAALSAFDVTRPVFVESESQRIGRLQIPEPLLTEMRRSSCIRLETPLPLRVSMLEQDYSHLAGDRDLLHTRLAPLASMHGKATIARWTAWAQAGATTELAADLLNKQYDPLYARAIQRNFPRQRTATVITLDDVSNAAMERCARELLETPRETAASPPI
jgi:tRNA 2-selenouridine synthase